MNGIPNVINTFYKINNGGKFSRCITLNHINLAVCIIPIFSVLVYHNRKRLIFKSILYKNPYGRKFLLIISYLILLILQLDLFHAKLTKDKLYFLVEKSFYKVRPLIKEPQIGLYNSKFILFNPIQILFN